MCHRPKRVNPLSMSSLDGGLAWVFSIVDVLKSCFRGYQHLHFIEFTNIYPRYLSDHSDLHPGILLPLA